MSKKFVNDKNHTTDKKRDLETVCPELYFSLSIAKLFFFIFGMGHLIRTEKEQSTK